MKKIIVSALAAIVTLLAVSGCAKPGEEFVHDNYTITSIYAVTPLDSTVPQISGIIDQETGDIVFEVPKKYRKFWLDDNGPVPVHVIATVGYDAVVNPPLTRLQTLSESDPLDITVTATMTGNSKTYHLYIKFLS